jgi:predicted RNA-binding Zn-ribbon protein involved in translation (DUF1610 family)
MSKKSILVLEEEKDDKNKKDKDKDKKKDKKGGVSPKTITRFDAAISACKTTVLAKKRNVETDKFGIITFNEKDAKFVLELTNNHDQILKSLDGIRLVPSGKPDASRALRGALALSIQEFANTLKFVGNLMLRVFVLTDDMAPEGITTEEKRLVKISRDIGVYIDILYFGPKPDNIGADEDADASGFFSDDSNGTETKDDGLSFVLKTDEERQRLEEEGVLLPGVTPESKGKYKPAMRKKKMHTDIRALADLTDGTFFDGQENSVTIAKWARKLGDIKDLEEGLDAFESAPIRKNKLMSAIAEQLAPLDLAEMQSEIEGKSDLKCQICFKKEDSSGAPFYATGRKCSYCKRTMHLSCAQKWAQQDQNREEDEFIFRCPFCFHLLKVDPKVSKLMDLQTVRANQKKLETQKMKVVEAFAVQLTPDQILQLYNPCEVCGVLLDENDTVYQCSSCGAAYHQKCFEETVANNDYFCRKCGAQLKSP